MSLGIIGLGLAATGCMVGPNFAPPKTDVPAGWVGPTDQMTLSPEKQAELVRWWATFGDATLNSLVERAAKSNLTLLEAESRVRQARAARGIAAADLWPTISANGAFIRSASPAPAGGKGPGANKTVVIPHSLFQVGLDATWEIDIFGGVRRNIEAADADIETAVEDRRDVLVTLVAEVGLNYVNLRGFQQRIAIAQDNLKSQKHSADLAQQRFGVGFASGLDTANANAQVATTASIIPLLQMSAQQAIYSLSVLLGRDPGALVGELSPTGAIPPPPPEIPITLPSELLRRRPDIRRAETQVHAATARICVATADLFPKFSLTGTLGSQSNKLETLMNWTNRNWSFGPSGSWTLFDGGRIGSNINLQTAFQEQFLMAYQQVVLVALQDVENALISYAKEQETRKALIDAVAANRKAFELSTKLYTEGLTDFLSVLIAERALFDTQDALVQSTANVSTSLVALYKALGGGWEDLPAEDAPPQK
ncbi:MAG: efflux transporter outer membrane subunit [Planctomycetota bacterium]|nr:efflux transporter outer membrane subunit [Planctomycetota bacterium]